MKNLYVNGCSFTAGDNLEDGFTWPELLAKKMNLDLNCRAVNGSSMDTIFYNTINHLQHFDSKDTYVVIGITWPERFGVFFDRVLLNVTPADLDNKLWETKISTFRRMSGPTLETIEKIDEYYPQIQHTKNYKKVLNAFLEYFKELMTYDPNLIEHSWIKMLTQVLALDSYLNDKYLKKSLKYKGPDYKSLAESFGAKAYQCNFDSKIDSNLKKTLNLKGLVLLEIRI